MKQALAILLLIFSTTFYGQGPEVRLAIDHITGPRLLNQTGTIAQQSAKYVHLFGWARLKGWTDAEIMSLSTAEAEWHNAFWSGENGNYGSPNPGHAINITVPAGKFPSTFPMSFTQGVYKGAGSRFHDSNGTHSYGSTEWYIDHANWKTRHSTDRIILRSANWGVDGGYGAWVHHYIIEGMHFNGKRRTPWMPTGTAESAGIAAWDSGEASEIRNCYFADFEKDGILLVRGTPVLITACSMFTTSRFGIAIVGSGSVTVVSASGDESGIALIGSVGGYGRPGSTRLAVFGAKQETSTSAEFRPWKGSSFLYAEGWINASISGVSYASSWTNPYDFITWKRDPAVGNFSSIDVSGTHYFGNAPKVLFYAQDSNQEYAFEGNAWQNIMQNWTWHETQGLRTPWKVITPVTRSGVKGRLQHVGQDGATSWATAGIYDPTGGVVAPPPPPQPTPCTYVTGAWSACVNGTQTRTVTASPAGCTGTPPASTQACTVTPPPVDPPPPSAGELPLKPSDVVVVVNANDPQSRAIADHYKATWGVTREVVLNLGNAQSIGTTAFNTERNKLGSINAQAFALCFTVPTRVNEVNGITSAITYGYTTPTSTTAATGYGKPSAAIKRATLVPSIDVINRARAATGTKPKGTIYTVLANDGGGTAPRGDARAPQVTGAAGDRIRARLPQGVNFVVQDNRQGCAGECSGNELVGKTDVLAYFGSMYKIAQWGTNTVLPGAYADNLTSTSGNLPTGQGQTPITAFLPSATSGTVAEPWASSSTNTARQFMRVDTFSVAYFGQGQSFAQAAYRAVERPWRLLIIGDPLCAPYANVTPTAPPPVQPPPVEPPPTGAVLGKWSFASGNPASIAGSVGPALVLASGTATISGGALSTTSDHTYWTTNVTGVKEVRLEGFIPQGAKPMDYQYIVTNQDGRGLIMLPDGSVLDNTAGDRPVLPAGTLKVGTAWTGTMTLPSPMTVRYFGAAPGAGNAWQGRLAGMEFR
jgi:hypothetical protein